MPGVLQPLDQKFAIVDAQGRPNLYFIKWAQQKQIDIGAGITAEQATALFVQYLLDHMLQEGSGIQLTPTGNISDSPTISAEVQAILDQITNVQGSVLFRGAAGWDELLPGTSGHFLKTNGAGANPEWAAGGGGGSTPWWWLPPLAASFALQTGDASNLILSDDTDVGMIVDGNTPTAGDRARMAYRTLTTPTGNWIMTARMNWAQAQVNFATLGLFMHDNTGGRATNLVWRADGSLSRQNLNTLASFGGETVIGVWGERPWIQIEKSGVNLFYRWSADGKKWHLWFSEAVTAWMANPPRRVGFGVLWNRTTQNVEFSVGHFSLTGTAV